MISHKRPENVPVMTEHIAGMPTTWVVPHGQKEDYVSAGAKNVLETKINNKNDLIYAKNMALNRAFNKDRICIMIHDDLQSLFRVKAQEGSRPRHSDKEVISFPRAIKIIYRGMSRTGAYLGGISPTNNPFFVGRKYSETHFILGDFTVFRPNPIRFNPAMKVKEDYYITCEHLREYKKVYRADEILATFLHYSNSGGCQEFRTSEIQAEAISVLMKDFPEWIRVNARRENEVLLRYKSPQA